MNVSREDSRLRIHIELDALCTYKDGDYIEFDISLADAITLRDRLNSLIDMMEEICMEGEE